MRASDRCWDLPIRPADNPFASHHIDALSFRPVERTMDDLAARLDALGGRADIIGPKGSGKTTLLEELALRLDGEVILVRLSGDCRNPWAVTRNQLPDSLGSRHTVLVDAAGQLGRAGRLMLARRARSAGRLVTTRHRQGRSPVLIECRTSPRLLADLVRELAPDHANGLDPVLEALFRRHDGNLRLCLRELYDVFAGIR
ncbi:MAG: hypothetical protein ACC742_12200 [Thermoanaerobaculales bacterium]